MSRVEEILDKKKIHYVPKGKDVLVKCFNPEHEDTHPSLRIDRETGLYHCLSCGYRGNLLTQLRDPTPAYTAKVAKIKQSISKLRAHRVVSYPADMHSPITYEYRGIGIDTLQKFGAFKSEEMFPDRIVIPISDYDENLVCMIGRYENTDISPKYLMKPKDVQTPLFPSPIKCDLSSGVLILVEGLLDVINLHDKSLTNVAATLGTKQLTAKNIFDKLLPYMSSGVSKIVIVFDPDKSGIESADKLKKLIDYNTDLVCEVYKLPGSKDPGSLTYDEVQTLKSRIM